MTSPDDVPRDGSGDPANGSPEGPAEPDQPFDEAAAWRAIVENYGERAQLGSASVDPVPGASPPPAPAAPPEVVDPGLFDRSHLDALDGRRADEPAEHPDHDHFVPPDPPPVPRGTPTRRLGWLGLFGPPLVMILAMVFDWTFPVLLSLGLVAAFIGGFVVLVATMPRDGGDGWDDGAVV